MKKLLIVGFAFGVTLFCSRAHAASWQDSVNVAIASGNMNQIDVIAAQNPASAGELALYLLQKSQEDYAKNPDQSAQLFIAAQPFIAQVPPGKASKSAADFLRGVESQAKDCSAQQKDCSGAAAILDAALSASSLPNIVAASPNLHATILSDATDAMEKNPAFATKQLEHAISLAQQPVTPSVPLLAPVPPSAD